MEETQSQTITKKPIGRYWALAFVVMSYVANLSERGKGEIGKADDNLLSAIVALIGIALYTLGRRRKNGKGFKGSAIIEAIMFTAVLYIFVTGYLNTGWSNNPLVWFVVPLWVLIAYLILVVKKNNY